MKRWTVLFVLVAALVVVGTAAAATNNLLMVDPGFGEANVELIGYDANCDGAVEKAEVLAAVALMDGRGLPQDEFSVDFDLVYPKALDTSHRVDLWVGAYADEGELVQLVARTYHHHTVGDPDCPECAHDADTVFIGPLGDLSAWEAGIDLPDCCDTWFNLNMVIFKITVTPETFVQVYDPVDMRYEYVYTADETLTYTVPVPLTWDYGFFNEPVSGSFSMDELDKEWFAILFW